MARPRRKIPSCLPHKASGQARARINGRDVYLGTYGSRESKEAYARLIAEQFTDGGYDTILVRDGERISIAALVLKFDDFVRSHYTQDGAPTDERYRIKAAMSPLVRLYGTTVAGDFGPKRLKAVREKIIKGGRHSDGRPLRRKYVNDLLACIKRMFRWAAEEELVPAPVYHSLRVVSGLRRGRAIGVRESEPVRPVPEEHIFPVIKELPPQVAAMVQLQYLTGMRPDEVTIIRHCDIDCSRPVWAYRPRTHKTEHHEIEKLILLGPKAQEVLKPWLDRPATAYLFSPKEVWEAWIAKRRKGKAPPDSKGELPRRRAGTKRKMVRTLRDHYDDESYCQAVERACQRAGVPKWTPGRLRHNAGTRVRAMFGAEAAQLVLGHRNLSTTEIYAERDRVRHEEIVKSMG